MEIKEVDLARLAMCIDCEGHIQIQREKQDWKDFCYSISLNIANTDYRLIKWLGDSFGFRISLKSSTLKGTTKPCFVALLSAGKASKLLERVLPFLIIKEYKAKLAIEMQSTMGTIGSSRISSEIYELRESIYKRSLEVEGESTIFKEVDLKGSKTFEVEAPFSRDPMDLARLAMCIDCEGSIVFTRHKNSQNSYYTIVSISNKDLNLMKWCKDKFGFTIRYTPQNQGLKKFFIFQAELPAYRLIDTLREIRPYFIIKGAKADLVIEFKGLGDFPGCKEIPESIAILREKLYLSSKKEAPDYVSIIK